MALNKRRHVGRAKLREVHTALFEPFGEELLNERQVVDCGRLRQPALLQQIVPVIFRKLFMSRGHGPLFFLGGSILAKHVEKPV